MIKNLIVLLKAYSRYSHNKLGDMNYVLNLVTAAESKYKQQLSDVNVLNLATIAESEYKQQTQPSYQAYYLIGSIGIVLLIVCIINYFLKNNKLLNQETKDISNF